MEYTVRALAKLSGVSPRTLRYYDQIGLLRPARVTDAGYRIYTTAEVDMLQHILFYRELGLSLGEIARLRQDPGYDPAAALRGHLAALEQQRRRLDVLILTVRKTIEHHERSENMDDKEKFEGFKQKLLAENEATYGAEIRTRYGDETVDASYRKVSGMSSAEYAAMTTLGEEILQRLEAAVKAGLDPADADGQSIAALHKQWLCFTWACYSAEAHRNLSEAYVVDPRFTAYYDKNIPGCAAFLRDAIHTHIS